MESLKDLEDRKVGVRVFTGLIGALGEFGGRQLLRAYGIAYADLKAWGGSTSHVGYNVIVDAFKDGRADLLLAVVTPRHPSVTELTTFSEVKFLAIEPDIIKALAPLGYTP